MNFRAISAQNASQAAQSIRADMNALPFCGTISGQMIHSDTFIQKFAYPLRRISLRILAATTGGALFVLSAAAQTYAPSPAYAPTHAQTGSQASTALTAPMGPSAHAVPVTAPPPASAVNTPTGGFSAPAAGAAAAPETGLAAAAAALGLEAASNPVPTTIAADYKIGPNDLLEVEVFGVDELKRTVRVNSSGHVSLPLIGTLPVAGLTSSDAQNLIAEAYRKDYLQDPQVSIFIKEFTSQRITVDGAVVRPGIYPLVGQITLLRALAMAGGGAQLSDLEKVVLFRLGPDGAGEPQLHDVNKIRMGEAPDPLLQGDDIVVVNRDSTRVGLRDSLFSDILNTLNPFSSVYRNTTAP